MISPSQKECAESGDENDADDETRIIKSVELPETEKKKTSEKFDLTSRMVEAIYEQSPDFFYFRKNFKFFTLNIELNASQYTLNTQCAIATHSIHNESCAELLDNDSPHIHFLIKLTKDSMDVMNKMTSTNFVVPCLLSFFKHLILGCSKVHLSGPLMEELQIAVNYNNSINNSTDIGLAPLRRRLPQVCLAS